ncbi:MAG TPA: hypothetical protein VHE54_15700, partial [Puia sp.]|nr:hypothetical protein [Puia sp.]
MSFDRFRSAVTSRRLPAIALVLALALPGSGSAQMVWNQDGNSYTTVEDNAIVEITLPAMTKSTLVSAEQLAPLGLPTREPSQATRFRGRGGALSYEFSDD